ncbi:LuxR C-terminal-related transcriptional regulator [Paenibacillaceae bacterium WGS1546]|uniref:LuxR C-terminal-related transcriptional regulator n=1 Tax=Cohnella sp. WGS1546 TaxID=3366810 RepID=UPI00372D0B2A
MKSSPEPAILQSKTALPVARSNLVERGRLVELVERSAEGRLTLVSAPAGFGKSTLLGQWAGRTERAVAWVSHDEMDNDFVRFWRYVSEALLPFVPAASRQTYMQLVQAMPGLSMHAFLDAFVNRIAEIRRPVTLVLEDYHAITEKRVHAGVAYFAEHKPRRVHLLISSRNELPFPIAKWKVQDEFAAIDAGSLAFTLEESEAFYRANGIPLQARHVRALRKQTEGWVAGLQLVSISLRSDSNLDQFVEGFKGNHREVSDYLFQEVVSKLPEDVREFLLRTSVLERMDAKACEAVTGRSDAGVALERIKALNLFLIPLDDHDAWFRYHHLFADFLRGRLRKTDPGLWRRSCLAASKSMAARGLLDDAIDLALAAEDFDLMESLLQRHVANVLKRGEFPSLLQWFDAFPEQRELSPEMSLLHAFLYVVTGQRDPAVRKLARLEAQFRAMEPGEARQQLQSGLLFVKSNLLFTFGEFEQWFAFIDGILDEILPHNPFFYNFNYNLTEPLVRRTAFGLKGMLSSQTERIGKLFAGVLEKHGWGDSLINLYVVQSLAEGFYEWNRLAESQELLRKIERASRLKLVPGLFVPNRIAQADHEWLAGRRALAHETLDEALRFVSRATEKKWSDYLHAAKARLFLREGSTSAAKKEVAKLRIAPKDQPTYHREYEFLTLCRLLASRRKETEALRLLERMKPQAMREDSLQGLTEICLLQAELYDRMGQRTLSMRAMREALSIGETNGYVRSFLDGGDRTEKLLQKYGAFRSQKDWRKEEDSGTDVSESYVSELLALFARERRQEPAASARQTGLIEPLTPTELQLLAWIRQGESNKRIAEIMSLSEGSVKVYSSRIYGKLGVSSRTQAVIAAQRLGLLQED